MGNDSILEKLEDGLVEGLCPINIRVSRHHVGNLREPVGIENALGDDAGIPHDFDGCCPTAVLFGYQPL